MDTIAQKRCRVCGEWKDKNEFRKHKLTKDGFDTLCRSCGIIKGRKYRIANPGQKSNPILHQEWVKKHPEKKKEWNHRYYLANTEKLRKDTKEWRRKNKDKVSEFNRNRRAREMSARGKISAQEFENLKKKYDHTCLCCGRREPEIKLTHDHVKPLSMGGDNTIENSQVLCLSCNSRKGRNWIDYRPESD